MAVEIERKFLLASDAWRMQVSRSEALAQAYLAGPPGARCSVRVRIAGAAAWLNIKSLGDAIVRDEYEYAIPLADAQRMLDTLCGARVCKRRHHVPCGDLLFEIDEFEGDNAGLLVAEIGLPAADAPFARPVWLGVEVSGLERYYNMRLATRPYAQWSAAERAASDV